MKDAQRVDICKSFLRFSVLSLFLPDLQPFVACGGRSRLQAAFTSIHSVLDDVSTYRTKVLDTFASSITTLQAQVGVAQKYLDEERSRASQDVQSKLKLGAPADLKL
ncbi:hypothetical protein Q0M94_27850 (plasmid) [Deinococcus radiomollis]|uniref:hypothetical protein n=1 Tax=Deinococcus radiomollis TaxID=468916 RepID=UPI003891A749